MSQGTNRSRHWRRALAVAIALAAVVFLGRPALHLGRFALADRPVDQVFEAEFGNDVSGLERTSVAETWTVPRDPVEAEAGLIALLARARAQGLPLSIAGSRHSMGGHTIAPGGVVVDMRSFDGIALDVEGRTVTCGAGGRWSQVLRILAPEGLSVAVMQSNENFTVGGSIGANCHGWQHGRPPIGSTVRSMRVLLSNGRTVNASREENRELFRHVIGGYGLFGIVLQAELDVVADESYSTTVREVDALELGTGFLEETRDPDVGLAIGRLSVAPQSFLEQALLKTLRRVPNQPSVGEITPTGKRGLRRAVFRSSATSPYGKELRWWLERRIGSRLVARTTTRNSELAEPVDWFRNHDPEATDVLVELFVPHPRLGDFIEAARPILRRAGSGEGDTHLLNVTVRDVRRDEDSALAYARDDVFGLVMLFHHPRTEAGEAAQRTLTRRLIDASLANGGTYYLPYRPHATREQFLQAYPNAEAFFAAKKRWDPEGLLRNKWFDAYGPR